MNPDGSCDPPLAFFPAGPVPKTNPSMPQRPLVLARGKRMAYVSVVMMALVLAHDPASFNFGKSLSWEPGAVIECQTVQDVIDTVETARDNGQRVKAFGTGWSFSTTLASDGDTYVLLKGPTFADHETAIDLINDEPSAIVGGGVKAFDLYMALQDTGFNIEAKGACLAARESQTVGGLLKTNVHHSGTKSFYDVVEWIDIVTSSSGLVRTLRDEPLFRLTVGGGGRTGVIVRAKFMLAPRETYQSADAVNPAEDTYEAFFETFAQTATGYQPNEVIAVGTKPFVVTEPYIEVMQRMSEASANPAVLPSNFAKPSFLSKVLRALDGVFDFILPPFLYNWYAGSILLVASGDGTPDRSGRTGEDLDVASSIPELVALKAQDIDIFIPVGLVGQVGRFLDTRISEGHYRYIHKNAIKGLRFVYGCNSLTAANGVLSDGSSPDRVAFELLAFQRSRWPVFQAEVNDLMKELSSEFPLQIRLHPGKYNPPLLPDPESDDVKEMILQFDPQGVFARDAYDPSYLTKYPKA